jgi:hypothetical protein
VSYRKSVVALQCCWRRKIARRELRSRRMEAREAGKLLQDKNALDEKLKETLIVLETVQNQRNELRQQYKVSPPPPPSPSLEPRGLSRHRVGSLLGRQPSSCWHHRRI